MRSKIAVFGHPIHPMLVTIPIGLFVWALAADFVYLATDRNQMWYDIAFWSGIAAILSALVAALPGFGDYLTMASKSDARDMALAHMVLNLTVVALFFVAMLLMLDNGATDGASLTVVIVLHALGVGLLTLSGWLGGEMVYRYHLAIVPDTPELESREHEIHEPGRRRAFGRGTR
jgi:uncharacterized membrane protein